MFLTYGNYQHADGEVAVSISRRTERSSAGVLRATVERWDISGRLQAADQATLTTALRALEAAYNVDGGDIALHIDASTLTAHTVDSGKTLHGVRVVDRVSYPEGRGAEYSTFRNYTVSIEAEIVGNAGGLLSWDETYAWDGDAGQQIVAIPVLVGPPIFQQTATQTVQMVTQTGVAVGNGAWPIPPAPAWPTRQIGTATRISRTIPGGGTNERVTAWQYTFLSETPLVGFPQPKAIS